MAARKKPVGRTPICAPSYARRIDPIWLSGHVPRGFWDDARNRRDYLLWLGYKLRFRSTEDYYKLIHKDIRCNGGAGVAQCHWRASAVEGVKQCFPEYEWRDWLFAHAPRGFWQKRENRHSYMKWLGERLGFRRPEDWYAVKLRDFAENKGGALLLFYRSTISAAVIDYLKYDWKEWLFDPAPRGFWAVRRNRHRYLRWLGKQLGYRRLDDWYGLRWEHFTANHGSYCLAYYHRSPVLAVKDLFPRHAWEEWRFAKVPVGFWRDRANRKRYVRWLAKKVGIRRPEDWRRSHFQRNYGGALANMFKSHHELLKDCSEGHVKLRCRKLNRPTRLSVRQILAWADAHHRRTGQWPNARLKTAQNWGAIDFALHFGTRGLPGGSCLAKLLTEKRGAPGRPPRLSLRTIAKWARQHEKQTGKWPTFGSGRIAGTDDTWCAVCQALKYGSRGLPGGMLLSSLRPRG
jgi:hypothetical protein